MADLIIRGMEMPQNGYECPMNSFGICHVSTDGDNCECYDVRPDWCPLVPLPEGHGRLGDLDALAEQCDSPHWCVWLNEIQDAPTIVPAEGGGKDGK